MLKIRKHRDTEYDQRSIMTCPLCEEDMAFINYPPEACTNCGLKQIDPKALLRKEETRIVYHLYFDEYIAQHLEKYEC